MHGHGAWIARAGALAALLATAGVRAQAFPDTGWHGDFGAGVAWTQASAPGAAGQASPLPYAYGDAGRFFVREDTFGVKLVPLGWGALELAGRYSTEGRDGDGPAFAHRSNPRPVGLGTFQETPWGGVFLDAFVDTHSGGTLLEASCAAPLRLGAVTLYPQVGVARRSARYAAHLVGVSAAEAAQAGVRAFAPGASVMPTVSVSGELPLAGHWVLVAHLQRDAFDHALRTSPRVATTGRTSALVALAWRFD